MKMKTRITFLLSFLFLFFSVLPAQTSLKIFETQWFDNYGVDGTFEEVVIAVQPQGAYMEVELFLTMSALGANVWGDELEIVLDFSLPSGSIVHDSWLWMPDETTIVKADVYDIRTATNIYEDIVDRAEDPSLLYRKEDGGYQLRIFPLEMDGYRKVKLTYLTPAIWTESSVDTWLPTQMFNHSVIPLSSARIITRPAENWTNPRLTLSGMGNLFFESATDPIYGEILAVDIPNEFFRLPIKFEVDAPFDGDGVYAEKLTDGADNFYQLAYIPPEVNHQGEAKKILVLIDNYSPNAYVNKQGLFSHLKEVMRGNLSIQDSFNIIFSKQGGNHLLSDQWISGEESSLNAALSSLVDPINNFPNLVNLLEDGINFVKNNGGEGDILLIANSDNESPWEMQTLTEQILNLIGGDDIRINIVNYQNLNYYTDWWWDGEYILYYNHKELYENLTFGTSGVFYSSFDGAFNTWESISSAFSDLFREDYFFDFDIEMAGGFTYDQYRQHYMGQSENPGRPIIQVGKFIGEMPMDLEFIGFGSEGNFVEDSKTIQPEQFSNADTLLRETWTGHHIRYLEGEASGNSDEQEIIDISITERVLSKYTAFLALDIENGGEPCLDCWEYDWPTVSNEELETMDIEITVSAQPNPFSDKCLLTFEIGNAEAGSGIVAYISDSFGKQVLSLDLDALKHKGKMEWYWNGENDHGQEVPNGIYFLTVRTAHKVQTLKLILLR